MVSEADAPRASGPVRGARALFVFHLLLFTYWAAVQVYYRVVAKLVPIDAAFFGFISWGLIAAALVLSTRFALARRGTASEGFARLAAALALIDFVGESLQLAPQLGLPSVIPSDRQMTELLVRSTWASCEFAMRSAMFMALWLAQVGADKRVRSVFFALVLIHWVIGIASFASAAAPYEAWWTANATASRVLKISPFLGLTWLGILVWLNHRVAGVLWPRTSPITSR